jgi:hypothetical protein
MRPARNERMQLIFRVDGCFHILCTNTTVESGHCPVCDPECEHDPVRWRQLLYEDEESE